MGRVCDLINFDKLVRSVRSYLKSLQVPVMLLKSISDKKFIRDAAESSLHSHASSAPHM